MTQIFPHQIGALLSCYTSLGTEIKGYLVGHDIEKHLILLRIRTPNEEKYLQVKDLIKNQPEIRSSDVPNDYNYSLVNLKFVSFIEELSNGYNNLEISNQKLLDKCIEAGLEPPKEIDEARLTKKLTNNCESKKNDAKKLEKGITKKASSLKLFLDKYFGTYEENVRWTDGGTILVLQEVEIYGPEFDKWSCRLVEEGGNQQSLSYVKGLVEKFDIERNGAL